MALSNASRIDAIKAMDQLSDRMGGNTSRISAVMSSRPSRHHRRSSSDSSAGSRSDASASSRSSMSKGGLKRQNRDQGAKQREGNSARRNTASNSTESSGKRQSRGSRGNGPDSRPASGSSKTAVPQRISYISISTDSTNLGEIPERKWRRHHHGDTSSDDYSFAPVYPLKPYQTPEVKERRFWGIFRRS